MKKTGCFLMLLVFLVLAGCAAEPPAAQTAAEEPAAPEVKVDTDLTQLSSTMLYSEVSQMNQSPELYIGKTIKIAGTYAFYHDDATGNNYFSCMVSDVTACCSAGIEFVLAEDYLYPDDYPQQNEAICVMGTFDTYMEGENRYCTLRNAVLCDLPDAEKTP